MTDSTAQPADAGGRLPSRDDLLQAARLLGCDLGPDAVPPSAPPSDLLVIAALVLGAAEVQMVNLEHEVLQGGGSAQDAKTAADLTALVTTADDPWANRRWLMWHASRLIYQLFMAEQRGALPPKVGVAAARSIYAAHQLLVDLADDDDQQDDLDRFPAKGLARAREELLIALNDLAELASAGDAPR